MKKIKFKTHHTIHHIDEDFITFFYNRKTLKHYQMLMNSSKFEQDLVAVTMLAKEECT